MFSQPENLKTREKQILAGLFLSKFDTAALESLGMESFSEAFNVIGYALGGKPGSIKNYRDEFDPLFPNPRRGWHGRPTRDYCMKIFDRFSGLEFPQFAALVQSFFGFPPLDQGDLVDSDNYDPSDSPFARRLATGLAAENYFRSVHPTVPDFRDWVLEDTTRLGCGYDFRMRQENRDAFLAVEVKGMSDSSGTVALTAKEYQAAENLSDRFYLFVVKNFRDTPVHEVYANPLGGHLSFRRQERTTVQVSWVAIA